jgi:hypothetical protein
MGTITSQRGTLMKIRTIAVAAALPIALAACASSSQHKDTAVVAAPTPAASQYVAPPAPEPSPNGTFSGSCNYTLGSNPAGGSAEAVGEIDEQNTGNIGFAVRVTISWPQEGFAPLTETKHIRLPSGASKAVRFHRPLSYTQLSNLQNWQGGHNERDGCHYHSKETATFGVAH